MAYKKFLILFIFVFSSCYNNPYGDPIARPEIILKNYTTFANYRRNYLRLSEDFVPLNINNIKITKQQFLNSLTTGDYLPVRLSKNNPLPHYKLFKISETTSEELREIIKNWSIHIYDLYNKESKRLPQFKFQDILGHNYNNDSISQKILILNCWFIGCTPCIAEMPFLNKLKSQYSNNQTFFLGLAIDNKKSLIEFLKKVSFNYTIIPDQKSFIVDSLGITMFPTHLLIKNGIIKIVTNDAKELESALKEQQFKIN